jgi:hypothetical protein
LFEGKKTSADKYLTLALSIDYARDIDISQRLELITGTHTQPLVTSSNGYDPVVSKSLFVDTILIVLSTIVIQRSNRY